MKILLLLLLLILIFWMGYRIIELENFRYATFVGFCSDYPDQFTVLQEMDANQQSTC